MHRAASGVSDDGGDDGGSGDSGGDGGSSAGSGGAAAGGGEGRRRVEGTTVGVCDAAACQSSRLFATRCVRGNGASGVVRK